MRRQECGNRGRHLLTFQRNGNYNGNQRGGDCRDQSEPDGPRTWLSRSQPRLTAQLALHFLKGLEMSKAHGTFKVMFLECHGFAFRERTLEIGLEMFVCWRSCAIGHRLRPVIKWTAESFCDCL